MSLRDWLVVRTYVYVRENNKPSPRLEGVISQNGEASYFYALRVLRGRFRRGEPSISENPAWAVKYARFVIRKRFPMAEEKIARNSEYSYEYFRHVMKGSKLPEEMHRFMLLMSFERPEDYFIKKYFSEAPLD
jgi:hypothetical protein